MSANTSSLAGARFKRPSAALKKAPSAQATTAVCLTGQLRSLGLTLQNHADTLPVRDAEIFFVGPHDMHYSKWHPTLLAHLKPVSKIVYAPEWRFVVQSNKVDQRPIEIEDGVMTINLHVFPAGRHSVRTLHILVQMEQWRACLGLIEARERFTKRPFQAIVRLRPDSFVGNRVSGKEIVEKGWPVVSLKDDFFFGPRLAMAAKMSVIDELCQAPGSYALLKTGDIDDNQVSRIHLAHWAKHMHVHQNTSRNQDVRWNQDVREAVWHLPETSQVTGFVRSNEHELCFAVEIETDDLVPQGWIKEGTRPFMQASAIAGNPRENETLQLFEDLVTYASRTSKYKYREDCPLEKGVGDGNLEELGPGARRRRLLLLKHAVGSLPEHVVLKLKR